jgi:hypothetical protein
LAIPGHLLAPCEKIGGNPNSKIANLKGMIGRLARDEMARIARSVEGIGAPQIACAYELREGFSS